MKKLLFLMILGFAGFASAKNYDAKLDSHKEFGISKLTTNKAFFYRYAYLYQSTCGWTFNMYTETPVGQMTPDQYDDYIDELITMNDHVCKLHGDKPIEGYVYNQNKVMSEKEKI
ncbi:hypothetical protein [Chryseobacterium populi]|uniref:Uncharacterized protein n=1 Tax=Chryseobacterium populi TaxID=1144316 RepID=J2K7A2_9FLAO|nr:hypothetical protein [Chryseobacterium populi]EJL76095.1 hypothetical protein PMI13_00065 [Chryseobacterium populi]